MALGTGAYYGTNYTVPFAHAYRALGELGVDRHAAIDRDVHHFKLLGLNAFRLHLWDVELTDSVGNLIDNEHLELLDYLLYRLEQNGIDIILTAQTNFGNGYPERNTDPYGGYSYDYAKCEVHDNPAAVAAQARYLRLLVNHSNRYTGVTFAEDPAIIAIEINNEPCHSGNAAQIAEYVDRMVTTLRNASWHKDILYNVSHNLDRTAAFYRPEIDGTTYQWYPSGLVHGSCRRGNFLPVLTNYEIPWDTIAGFSDKSRVVYEYDPADVLDTYLYPAAARTFRKAGFEWATQFAYDPIDMARFNTEYQTHFLNVAYTPGKAVGMAIAAEAMRTIPLGADYGKYPADTIFGESAEFLTSASRNLALLNDGEHYYNTNATDVQPRSADRLKTVKGVGSSPIVKTDGTGAYFLDRISDTAWRLELLPDVFLTSDPFEKPNLHRSVADIINGSVTMTLLLPGLSEDFYYEGVTCGRAEAKTATFMPGVYLLSTQEPAAELVAQASVDEYVMPPLQPVSTKVLHTPAVRTTPGVVTVSATVLSDAAVDSVVIYPGDVNFWREDNRLIRMSKSGKYNYCADVEAVGKELSYWIVVYTTDGATTFPGGVSGTPLDWDFCDSEPYKVPVAAEEEPIVLVDATKGLDGMELAMIPESWRGLHLTCEHRAPQSADVLRLSMSEEAAGLEAVVATKYVEDLKPAGKKLTVRFGEVEGTQPIDVIVTTSGGYSYAVSVNPSSNATVTFDENDFRPTSTMLNPCPYPAFMERWFTPEDSPTLRLSELQTLTWGVSHPLGAFAVEVVGVWMEK